MPKDFQKSQDDLKAGSDAKISASATIRQIADAFTAGVHIDQSRTEKNRLEYYYFIPKLQQQKRYPLVIALHGAFEGKRNTKDSSRRNLISNRVVVSWADPANQEKRPCFVVAPIKEPNGYGYENWESKQMSTSILGCMNQVILQYPETIDLNRIYITGASMGGGGTFSLVMKNPEIFAACMPVCGTYKNFLADDEIDEAFQKIAAIPMWLFHCKGDVFVNPGRHSSREAFQKMREFGGEVHYTEYNRKKNPKVGLLRHASWVYAYEDEQVMDWLFSKIKQG